VTTLPAQSNRLGNGDFELWSDGVISDGPIPPDLWLPMGTTLDLLTQTAIGFKRVPAAAPSASCDRGPGECVLEITPGGAAV
jgi:hypothetical protein